MPAMMPKSSSMLKALCLALTLAAISISRLQAQTPAVPVRSLNQKIVIENLGDARVEMVWTLTSWEYSQFTQHWKRTILEKGADGKEVKRDIAATIDDVIPYLDLRQLGHEFENVSGTLDEKAKTVTVRFRVPGFATNDGRGRWRFDLFDNLRWHQDLRPVDGVPAIAGLVRYELTSFVPYAVPSRIQYPIKPQHPLGSGLFESASLVDWTKGNGPSPFRVNALAVNQNATATIEARGLGKRTCRIQVELPESSKNVRLDGLRLTYDAASLPRTATGRPEFQIKARPELMAGLHKVYGDPKFPTMWTARTQLRNNSNEALIGYRIRHKMSLPGINTQWSDWQDVCGSVLPGQNASMPIHAILPPDVTRFQSQTAAFIEVQNEYTRPNGEKIAESLKSRIELLGVNDAVFNHHDIKSMKNPHFYDKFHDASMVIGSYVTASDPVIREAAGKLAAAIAGTSISAGATPEKKDAAAMKLVEAIYEMLRHNIAYKLPWANTFDGRLLQRIQFGRETLQNRTGTCLDLAVLFVSLAEACNLEASIGLLPDHAFPIIILPGTRKMVAVESTGCAGGTTAKSFSFEDAMRFGKMKMSSPAMVTIHIQDMRYFGVSTPELSAPNGDALKNITFPEVRPNVTFKNVTVKADQTNAAGKKGVMIEYEAHVRNGSWRKVTFIAKLNDANGKPINVRGPAISYTTGPLGPSEELATFKRTAFVAYDDMPVNAGKHDLKWSLSAWSEMDNMSIESKLESGSVSFTIAAATIK